MLGLGLALAVGSTSAAQTYDELVAELEGMRQEGRFRAMLEMADEYADDDSAGWRAYFLKIAAECALHFKEWDSGERYLRDLDAQLEGREGEFFDHMRCFAKGLWAQARMDQGSLDLANHLVEEQARSVELFARRLGGEDPNGYLARAEGDLHLRRLGLLIAQNEYVRAEEYAEELLGEPAYAEGAPRAHILTRLAKAMNELECDNAVRLPRLRHVIEEALPQARGDDRLECLIKLAESELRWGEIPACRSALELLADVLSEREPDDYDRYDRNWAVLNAGLALAVGEREDVAAALPPLERALTHFEAAWRSAELRPGGFGILQFEDVRALLGELTRVTIVLDGPEAGARRGLELLARVQSLGSLCRRIDCGAPGLDETLQLLLGSAPGTGLLVYLPGRDRTHVFLAGPGGIEHHLTERIGEIERVSDLVAAELEDARRTAERMQRQGELLAELGRLLLPPPVRARLASWQGVAVIGLDAFRSLPFEALPFEDGTVGTRLVVGRLPSLPVGAALQRRLAAGERATRGLRLVTDPDYAREEDRRIALGADRVDRLAATFPADERDICTGAAATADRLAGTDAEQPRVLAVVAHGVEDRHRPLPRGVALTPTPARADGVLWASEVPELERVAPLVLLASCRSGRAPRIIGDAGSTSLAGAFLEAGAQAVVASDYDLDLAAAETLVRELLRGVRAGASPAEALRDARARVAADPRFQDPYHYATLQVVGLGFTPLYEPAAGGRLGYGGLGLGLGLLVAVVLAVRRRRGGVATPT